MHHIFNHYKILLKNALKILDNEGVIVGSYGLNSNISYIQLCGLILGLSSIQLHNVL